ncbi:MAG: hypothetical protein IPP88_15845 [Betaproteobacteria bacterium]|nr:hypothetical protein [Betaproteobacteria bacterium]
MVKADLPDDPRSEWDIRDEFEDLCVEIFSNLVLFPVGAGKLRIAPSYRADGAVLSELKVIPHEHADLLVAESEGNSFRSYDLSISVASDAQLDLRFRAFFDYWELGLRDLEYCHAVVAACPDRPQFVGRNVLVRATQAKYELSAL